MFWLLYSWGKSSWYPLDRRMGEPQNWSGHSGKEKYIPSLPLLEIEPWLSSP